MIINESYFNDTDDTNDVIIDDLSSQHKDIEYSTSLVVTVSYPVKSIINKYDIPDGIPTFQKLINRFKYALENLHTIDDVSITDKTYYLNGNVTDSYTEDDVYIYYIPSVDRNKTEFQFNLHINHHLRTARDCFRFIEQLYRIKLVNEHSRCIWLKRPESEMSEFNYYVHMSFYKTVRKTNEVIKDLFNFFKTLAPNIEYKDVYDEYYKLREAGKLLQ